MSAENLGEPTPTTGREDSGSIGVLGPVVLLDPEGNVRPVGLGGPKQRLVLSMLVSQPGRVVPTDSLVRSIWGENARPAILRTLRAYISRLRKALDGAHVQILHRHGGYVLQAGATATDAAVFERRLEDAAARAGSAPRQAAADLRAALAMWRGPAFGDLTLEPPLAPEVGRLEELRLQGFELLAELEIGDGRHEDMLPQLRALLDEHPLREPLWHLLMVALYRAGRQGEALQAYELARENLAAELGADPSPQLQGLHKQILRQDPLVGARTGSAGGAQPRGPTTATPMRVRTLVGRDSELAQLVELLAAARSGRPRLLLLGGEAGIGKSRLVEETALQAQGDGMEVLVGRCIELGSSTLPLAPLVQVLRHLARGASTPRIHELLGPARHQLARLVPELGEAPPAGRYSQPSGVVFSAVLEGLGHLARRRPLLLVLEDIHWADRSTLDLLGYLARNLDDEQLLLAATYRTDELHRRHPLRGVLGELVRVASVNRLELGPLERDAAATMIRGLAGGDVDEDVIENVFTRSSGIPFYLEELVTAVREGHPALVGAGLRDVIVARLERLEDAAYRFVKVVAVAGGSADPGLLAAVTGEDPLELASHLRAAVDLHVLVPDGTALRFRHDLVREVVDDDLLPGERLALHAGIAAGLEAAPQLATGGADHVNAEVAHHWLAAREPQRAFDAFTRAAERARTAGAYVEALYFDERVLELWGTVDPGEAERIEVLATAAETARRAGRYRRGISLMREALDEVDDEPVREADLRSKLALMLFLDANDQGAALAEADRILHLVEGAPRSSPVARITHTVARLHLMSSDWEPLLELATHSLQLARAFGDEVNELHARVTFGTALCGAGQEVAGLAELREALERGRLLGEDELVARAYNNLVVALRESPDMDPALLETTMREALEWLDEPTRTEGAHLTGARTNVAWAALDRGAWEVADQALDALRVDDLQGIDRADYLSARAALSWARGRLDDAMEDANSILGLGLDDFWDNHVAHLVTARVAAERSQVAQVRRTVDRALSMRGTHRHLNGRVAEMRLLRTLIRAEVDAAMQAKAPDLARLHDAFTQIRELHHLLTAEEAVTWPSTRAHAARELRLAEAERDRVDGPSPASWQAVLEVGGIAAYDRVYARWRLAEALLDAGDRARGTAELRAANHEAVTLGAELLAEHVVRTAAHYELDPTATAADG